MEIVSSYWKPVPSKEQKQHGKKEKQGISHKVFVKSREGRHLGSQVIYR